MSKVLLIKTSSLGDVVHNLPVVTDIRRALGEVVIDWVVERAFAAIPAMHPGVRNVICCELRQWRRSCISLATRRAWRVFVGKVRGERYDCVIDTQGLLKSAIITRAAHGRRVGLDWKSSREPLRPFYDQVFNVPRALHAVERNRSLAALALSYQVAGEPDYGIAAAESAAPWFRGSAYAVLIHATSQSRKLWPEKQWVEFGEALLRCGVVPILPWGDASEQERATRLAASLSGACVAPALSIAELASVIAGARFAVGVDTGLTHLAAALGVPVVGIFGATDPRATGVRAASRAVNLGGIGRFPSSDEVVAALRDFGLLA